MSRSFYFLFPTRPVPEAPKIGQHVRIEGQPGVYIVLRLDPKRFAADLMLTTGKHEIEENVPYIAIEAINEKTAEHDHPTTPKSKAAAA